MDRKNVKTIEKVLTKATCSHGILQIPIGGPDDSDKDGSLYQEEMTITPVSSQRGDITHFVAIKQDITERLQAEERLRETARFFRSVLELAPDGLMMADADGMAAGIVAMVRHWRAQTADISTYGAEPIQCSRTVFFAF